MLPSLFSELPRLPQTYELRDWKAVTRGYVELALSEKGGSEFLPLMWRDGEALGLPSYVGHPQMTKGADHEGITVLGTLLGGTLVGADVRTWIPGAANYFSIEDGVALNRVRTTSGQTFWYEVFPSILFAQIADRNPWWSDGRKFAKDQAKVWARAADALKGDFDHTSIDLRTMKPVDNGRWKEPDAAAGLAYLQLGAGNLDATKVALDALQAMQVNPTYELLTSYGALAAARMNAEHGTGYDMARFLDWAIDVSPTRPGWGMVTGRWGGFDIGGLVGSTTDGGGYAFAMNTFVLGGNLAPLARYDDRYSAAVARWFVNAASASRHFYGIGLPEGHLSTPEWKGDPEQVIPCEGLRKEWKGIGPVAMGDPTVHGWAKTDRCLYAGGYAGIFGAIVSPTEVKGILALDLRATDFFAPNGYPTRLVWNPYETAKTVTIDLGSKLVRVWDAVGNRELARKAKGRFRFSLKGDQAVQLVLVPSQIEILRVQGQLRADGKPVDFRL